MIYKKDTTLGLTTGPGPNFKNLDKNSIPVSGDAMVYKKVEVMEAWPPDDMLAWIDQGSYTYVVPRSPSAVDGLQLLVESVGDGMDHSHLPRLFALAALMDQGQDVERELIATLEASTMM